MGYRRSIILRLAFGSAALGILALLTLWLWFPRAREDGAERHPSSRGSGAASAASLRSLPLEALPELTFDEALTLLGCEVQRFAQDRFAWSRVESVASRLEGLHRQNLEKIKKAGLYYASLPPQARSRFAEFESEYQRRYDFIRDRLTALREGGGGAGAEILELLRGSGALRPPREVPAGKDLPRRTLPAEHREPRAASQDWKADRKVGSARREIERGAWELFFGERVAHAQESGDDLGETSEVKFDPETAPEVQRLLDAEGLRGSPAKIANWVRNHIEFVPIWGSLQSSVGCLDTRKGTAMDVASLTIALLRASGIRARYQAGTVRIPIEKAMNWLGNFQDATAAASLLSSGGTPAVVQVDETGRPVALRFEHVWARAYVDYVPSQGACHVEGDTWVDIDTSIKTYEFLPAPDLSRFFPPGFPESAQEDYLSKAVIDPATQEFTLTERVEVPPAPGDEGRTFLLETAGTRTFHEILGGGRIRSGNARVLGGAPPFEVLARGWDRGELLPSDRFSVTIELRQNGEVILAHSARASEIGRSRFSVSFEPESDLDRVIIAEQLPEDITAPTPDSFLVAGVRLLPQLLRDSRMIAAGKGVAMGTPLELVVEYAEPALETPPIQMHVVAGEPVAIALDLIQIPNGLLQGISTGLREILDKVKAGSADWDLLEFQELLLSAVVHTWFAEVDQFGRMGIALGCVTHRYPSAGICSSKWQSETLFGLPLAGSRPGITVDIPGDVVISLSRRGDTREMRDVTLILGLVGSGLEGQIPARFFSTGTHRAIWLTSSNALLANLNSGGLLVLISPSNLEAVLPRMNLKAAETDEIREAVDRGLSVFAHEDALADGAGKCHSGYIVLDPLTGNGIYRIAGGLCGAEPFQCALDSNPNQHPIHNFGGAWFRRFRAHAELLYRGWLVLANEDGLSPSDTVRRVERGLETFFDNTLLNNREFSELSVGAGVGATQVAFALVRLQVYHDAFKALSDQAGPDLGIRANWAMGGILQEYESYVRFNQALSEVPVEIPEACFERRPVTPGR